MQPASLACIQHALVLNILPRIRILIPDAPEINNLNTNRPRQITQVVRQPLRRRPRVGPRILHERVYCPMAEPTTAATSTEPKPLGKPQIHPSAIIDSRAEIGAGCIIGPGCVIVGAVTLAEGVELMAQVYLQGPLTIGARTRIWPGARLGCDPQDYKVKPGFPTAGVVVGSDCLIREGVTVHAATKTDAPTRIGDRVFMMVNSHAGHDVQVSNDVILVNGVLLAGHVQVHERAVISGNTGVHQFCRVGKMAMISGCAAIATEVPPYCMAYGRNSMVMLNVVGMRRSGISREHISIARQAYREVFRENLPKPLMIERLTELGKLSPPVAEMAEFVRTAKRAITPHRAQRESDDGSGE